MSLFRTYIKMIRPSQLKVTWSLYKTVLVAQGTLCRNYSDLPTPLRSTKSKSRNDPRYFVDYRRIQVIAGSGGQGCLSFMQLWCNERAGPDGGNGGHGGHVIIKASVQCHGLDHVLRVLRAESGERGRNRDCDGRNAKHLIIDVPLGTIVKRENGQVVADLSVDGTMFLAARGGAGGRGNHYFASDLNQSPQLAEYGGKGEIINYTLELRCMADVGLIGFPNAGKSTLLQAISRAKPEVAPYPFTTLRPFIGMIQYSDFEQVSVADLPGLVENSHKNEGLGIGFLRHAERCAMLAMVLDLSEPEPWRQLAALNNELYQFSPALAERPQLLIANKIDLPNAQSNLEKLKTKLELPVIPISGKKGINLTRLLQLFRQMRDEYRINSGNAEEAANS